MNHVCGLLLLGMLRNCIGRCKLLVSSSALHNMAWCRRHTFVVIGNDKDGLNWFVCGMDCCVLGRLIICGWESLSSIALIHPFLVALKQQGLPPSTGPWDSKRMFGLMVFRACTSQTSWLKTGVPFGMFASPQCLW